MAGHNLMDYGKNLVVVSQNPQDYGSTAAIHWIVAKQPQTKGSWQTCHIHIDYGYMAIIIQIQATGPKSEMLWLTNG